MTNGLSFNQKRFIAELIGTFVVVIFATGSVVLAVKYSGTFGLWFVVSCSRSCSDNNGLCIWENINGTL